MAKRTKIMYQPLMRRLAGHGHDNRYAVKDGESLGLLMAIKGLLEVFAPIGDDYLHGLWIEVPRGKPSDWVSFKEAKEWGDVSTRKESLAKWKAEVHVTLDETVPLEDKVYDLIRDEVTEPLTVCGILGRLEEKYGIGVGWKRKSFKGCTTALNGKTTW